MNHNAMTTLGVVHSLGNAISVESNNLTYWKSIIHSDFSYYLLWGQRKRFTFGK